MKVIIYNIYINIGYFMFHIIASDLDGTLLTPNNRLTLFTKKILRLLNTFKVHFVFATGRDYINVKAIRDDLNISAYMITSNGSRIYNDNNKLVASYNLDPEIVYDLLCIRNYDNEIIINIFQKDIWLVNRCMFNQRVVSSEKDIVYKIYQKDKLIYDEISKIYFNSNNYKKLLLLEKKLNIRWGYRINVSFSLPTCLEIIPGGISKGFALQQVAYLLGYELKDCIAFGDGMNDKEMLLMSGKGCIMYNAQQRLKDALPSLEIIGSNQNEAVPNYLKNIYFC